MAEEETKTESVPRGEEIDWDAYKVFVSRIPAHFSHDSVKRLLEDRIGDGSVSNVSLIYKKPDVNQEQAVNRVPSQNSQDEISHEKPLTHRGFAFVSMESTGKRDKALELGTVRGGAKKTSTKRHTLYLRPVLRKSESENNRSMDSEGNEDAHNICFLWSAFRCPYGDECKFSHKGVGGCAKAEPGNRKVQKCFAFKKGKCKAGDNCKFSHEFEVVKNKETAILAGKVPDSEKDCISWKTKGKCRRRDKCPYRHEESVKLSALSRREQKKRRRQQGEKVSQPLSVRVFGLNYETTKEDMRNYFQHCGKIVEITFPTFEDSGRSKGYCGVLFQSPKAVAKAVELDGNELHGRWLRIQAGKMYIRQWEEQERNRQRDDDTKKNSRDEVEKDMSVGEFGQKVKRRKKHGFKE